MSSKTMRRHAKQALEGAGFVGHKLSSAGGEDPSITLLGLVMHGYRKNLSKEMMAFQQGIEALCILLTHRDSRWVGCLGLTPTPSSPLKTRPACRGNRHKGIDVYAEYCPKIGLWAGRWKDFEDNYRCGSCRASADRQLGVARKLDVVCVLPAGTMTPCSMRT